MGIGDSIKIIAQTHKELTLFTGKVLKVDTSKRICDVEPNNGDAIVYGVRLQASTSEKDGFLLIPCKDSEVTILMFDDIVGCVVQTSCIEKFECNIGNKVMNITSKGIAMKSGQISVKSEIDTLISEIDSLYDLLIQPGLFIAGAPPTALPVTIMPTGATKLTQKKLKIQQLKQSINSILTD
jgi:hypothetical protein